MKKILADTKRDFILMAILCIVAGILFVIFPDTSSRLVCYVIGIGVCVWGVIHLVLYFVRTFPVDIYRYDLVQGLIGLGVGIFIIARPKVLMAILPIAIGVVIVFDSFLKLQHAIDLSRMHDRRWWMMLLLAVISGVLGCVVIFDPFAALNALFIFMGISLIVNGVSDFLTIFRFSSWVKKTRDASADEEIKEHATDVDYVDVDDDKS